MAFKPLVVLEVCICVPFRLNSKRQNNKNFYKLLHTIAKNLIEVDKTDVIVTTKLKLPTYVCPHMYQNVLEALA